VGARLGGGHVSDGTKSQKLQRGDDSKAGGGGIYQLLTMKCSQTGSGSRLRRNDRDGRSESMREVIDVIL